MFRQPKPKSKLELEIARLTLELKDHKPISDEYGKILDRLKELNKIQSDNAQDPVSANTKAQIAANLIGIFMIIHHEHLGVISTKAIGMLSKVR